MENNFISATKIKLGENLLKNELQTYFLGTKISVLKILNNYISCQLIVLLSMKYSINSSRISFVSIAALSPHFEFCSVSHNLVYSPEDPGIRSPLLFFASIRSGPVDPVLTIPVVAGTFFL